ncbi:hypothetical protein Zmor_017678 [Zophobas morio]|uniref:Peptidase aspartic putative domain-containing protein n=1 Tax=Zophobas morio TaxID=2755281 RepID=A0AA38MCZ0_9CUCU|nr:hypothetical protein Zmor_017678 [Zophobas morio]
MPNNDSLCKFILLVHDVRSHEDFISEVTNHQKIGELRCRLEDLKRVQSAVLGLMAEHKSDTLLITDDADSEEPSEPVVYNFRDTLKDIFKLHGTFDELIRKGDAASRSSSPTFSNACNIRKHHTLLHAETNNNPTKNEIKDKPDEDSDNAEDTSKCNLAITSSVLLSTALIHVKGPSGKVKECRVLLDIGSQSHFITEDLCKALELNINNINMSIVDTVLDHRRYRCCSFIDKVNRLVWTQINKFQ